MPSRRIGSPSPGPRVSEKTLELNVGAEILSLLRRWFHPKAWLRGLTQAEERVEGADFFAVLPPRTGILAFQFKAPLRARGRQDIPPYDFRLNRDQHAVLFPLARSHPRSVLYALPFFRGVSKLEAAAPTLLSETWFLRTWDVKLAHFGTQKTCRVSCVPGTASINPEIPLHRLEWESPAARDLVAPAPVERFREWYDEVFRQPPVQGGEHEGLRIRNPWIARELRVCIIPGTTSTQTG